MPSWKLPTIGRYLPATLLVGCLILIAAFSLRSCTRHRAGTPAATSLAPFATVGRGALPGWSNRDRSALSGLLDRHFAPVLHSKKNGFVVLANDGSVLYDRNGSAPRAPASTLKVLTAATALHVLGPEYRFITRISALDAVTDGVLDGDLYVIGGGDPMLLSGDLHLGVGALYQQGLRKVLGHVVVDTTAFGGPEQNPHWSSDDLNLDYAAGTNALSLDGDVEIFRVFPMTVGAPAQIRLDPQNKEVQIVGSITTVGSGGTVHIDHTLGQNMYSLSGSINAGAEQRFPIPVGKISAQVGGVVDGLLQRRGINVLTPARIDAAPLGAQVLWEHQSAPLRDIAHHMLIVSDNHVAEQLLRTIAASSGHRGVEAQGIAVETALLAKLGVVDRGLHLYDGSGLSPGNRISPRSLAAVLADAANTPGNPLINDLPRVGIEGTVAGHQLNAARGLIRAKSGHITGVDGLAGTIQTRHHGLLAFAFITNDADDGTVESAEDAIFDDLVKY